MSLAREPPRRRSCYGRASPSQRIRARSLVLSGSGLVNAPGDQREDVTLYNARWKLAAPLPGDAGTAARDGLIPAADAARALNSDLKHAGSAGRVLWVRVRLRRVAFMTDRG